MNGIQSAAVSGQLQVHVFASTTKLAKAMSSPAFALHIAAVRPQLQVQVLSSRLLSGPQKVVHCGFALHVHVEASKS
jgi:hypothetical protein